MKREPDSEFGKPDDLSFILYRPNRRSTSSDRSIGCELGKDHSFDVFTLG